MRITSTYNSLWTQGAKEELYCSKYVGWNTGAMCWMQECSMNCYYSGTDLGRIWLLFWERLVSPSYIKDTVLDFDA